jgi:hypothetical protein
LPPQQPANNKSTSITHRALRILKLSMTQFPSSTYF